MPIAIAYKQERWSLEDLFPAIDAPEVKAAQTKLETTIETFHTHREELISDLDGEEFFEILQAYEAIDRALSRLAGYASLLFSGDTQDQAAQAFRAKMMQLAAEADNRTMFFKLWWKGLEDQPAERLLTFAGDYQYWLEALRLQKPYTLSEPEEKIINLKDVNGPNALVSLYTTITNRYVYTIEVNGELKELNQEELQSYRYSPDPDMRAAAYQSLFKVFEKDAPILGQIYQYIVRDWRSEGMDLRGYSSPISMRNLGNNIPDKVVEMLLDVCKENASLFHRYFGLKARLLGVDRLRRYDLYAPVAQAEKTYAYGEAVGMVLESFHRFDPRFGKLAQRVFDEGHIDSEVRSGKRGGAFCSTITPDLTPWVLHSFVGQPRNVATMAHELGHAIHSMLASDHTSLTQSSSLPLAETASTFGEMMMVDQILATETDEAVKRDLLFKRMDDAYATIMRQSFFAMFEKEAHEQIAQGAQVDDLNRVYLQNLKAQFGNALDLSDDFQVEWVGIGHFYFAPFYVYAYAFGQLLVLSLYQQYREEGDSFKPRYVELLSAGGSASPEEILTRAGIDMYARSFWQGGFDVLERDLEHLEGMGLGA
ncbi:MAG: M3 family oligoendopeptidase [Lysobacterales bacterium]|nr:MAG: M3 family oligoendopeptidase [Xanthomonadales bacterium]